jgi:cytochrome c553
LAGLPAAYVAEQLQAWKAGNRPPGPLALMPAIASKLSDTDITAVAAYYENLAAPGTGATSGAAGNAQPAKAKGRP